MQRGLFKNLITVHIYVQFHWSLETLNASLTPWAVSSQAVLFFQFFYNKMINVSVSAG